MAITYPLSFPSQVPARITLRLTTAVGMERFPFTKTQQVQVHAGQAWELECYFPPMEEAAGEALAAFLGRLNGFEGTFLIGDPSKVNRGTVTGVPVIDGAAQTGTSINLRGFDNSSTGNLLEGDYMQLGTGAAARLHKVLTSSVDADGSGNAAVDLWPRVTAAQALTDGQSVITSDPVGLFRLLQNDSEYDVGEAKIYGHRIFARSEN